MVTRRPLVVQDGFVAELPLGDTVAAGTSTTEVVAGSGLVGGGSVSSNPRVDFALAANPSGIIYVGDSLGIDGAAQISADTALASGSAAAVLADSALASGNASLVTASAALASGNAALDLVPTLGGGGGGTVAEFTAASAVVSGYAVGVDDAGKVQSVNQVVTDNSNPPTFGSTFSVQNNVVNRFAQIYDPTNQKVLYFDSTDPQSYYLSVKVGTVSGTTVTYGSYTVIYSVASNPVKAIYDELNDVFVVTHRRGSNGYVHASTLRLSGSTITVGTNYQLSSAATGTEQTIIGDGAGKFACIWDNSSNNYGTYRVGILSGTSVSSFGSITTFNSSVSEYWGSIYDSVNQKNVVFYRDYPATGDTTIAQVATFSGTSLSFGAKGVPPSNIVYYNPTFSFAFHSSAGKIIIAGRADSASYGVQVATVSGTTVSFGSAITQIDPTLNGVSVAYTPIGDKIFIAYGQGNARVRVKIGTLSGTTVSLGSSVEVYSSRINTDYIQVIYDSDTDQMITAHSNSTNGTVNGIVANPLAAYSYTPTLNSYPNVLGISQSTVASGSTCLVNLPGTLYNDPAAGLTTGAFYYADPTTSGVTTTSTKPTSWDGQVPWNYIGRAVTSSGLMLLKSI